MKEGRINKEKENTCVLMKDKNKERRKVEKERKKERT